MKLTEKEIQNAVAHLLAVKRIYANRSRMDKPTTTHVGWPDFTFAVCGQAVAWEVKLPGREPTFDQEAVHIAMRANGWIVQTVHSLDEAIALLEAIEGRNGRIKIR